MKKQLTFFALWLLPSWMAFAQCPSASFTSTAPACTSTNVNFTNTSGNTGGGWTYFWDFDYPNQGGASPNTSTSQNPSGVNYSGGGSGVYTVAFTITNSGMGCTSTVLMDIDIRRSRADFLTSTNTACVGDNVSFYNEGTPASSPTTSITHSWSFGSGAVPSTSNLANPPAVIYTTAGAKTITHYVEVNYGGCGGVRTDMVTQNIIVNPEPIVAFTSTAPVCQGASIDFTYTGSTSSIDQFNWDFGSNSTPSVSTTQDPVGIGYSTSGTKLISLTVTNQYGCVNTGTQNIVINTQPVASFSSTAPECTGLPVDFTNTGTTGISYLWNFDTGAGPSTSTAENPANIVYSSAGIKTISLTVDNGFCTDNSSQTITIHQTPTASFTTNAPQCADAGIDFTNTGSSGFNWSYNWDFGLDAAPTTSGSENPAGIMYASGGNKTITLTVVDQFCTSTSTGSINVYLLPLADAGPDTTICSNTTVQIGAANNVNYTYSWFPSNALVISDPVISDPVASPVDNSTNYIVTVTETSTGCVSVDTAVVNMILPIIANAGIDVVICRYDSIQIGAALIENQHYLWSPIAGLTGSLLPNPMVSPDSTTTYTLTVSNEYNCPTVTDEVTVIVHQLPLVNAGLDDTITVGSSTQLIATGALQYSWSPDYQIDNIGIYNPIVYPDVTTDYAVTGIDVYGCINSDTMTVIVLEPSFWVPTAFTPDGNGNNDIFYVRGEGITDFEFRIFNKWGELIFFSNSLETGWNGRRQITEEELPEGAYVYKVSGVLTNGEPVVSDGIVNLIR